MIKRLTEVKAKDVSERLIKMSKKVVKSNDEDDVRKESLATLTLFKWMETFYRVGELHHARGAA